MKPINLNQRIRISQSSLFVDMDGEIVSMNVDKDLAYGISGLGVAIWNALQSRDITGQRLLEALASRYPDTPADIIEADLTAFLARALDAGLLEFDGA